MSKLFTEEAQFDPSQKAGGVLDYILDDTSETTQEKRENTASVEEELKHTRLIQKESQRVQSRVLFITNNVHVLEKDSVVQQYFSNVSEVFDEVHVMVLGVQKTKAKAQRLKKNVWVYPVFTKYFFQLPFTARSFAKRELQFTGGFRPDMVVACDPFESALAAQFIAKKFKRPYQVHITKDFYTKTFKEEDEYNSKRIQIAGRILKKAVSVRVRTDTLKTKIQEHFPKIVDIAVLPRFFNIQETLKNSRNNQSNLYPQFAFTVLFIGVLDADSTLFRAIDSVRPILRTQSIGFVVIGEGSAKEQFKQRAKLLGIDQQVVFKSQVDDVVSYMQSADVLICTDTNSDSEKSVITAAAAGLPLLISHTTLRDDLFTDDQDVFLCDPEDTICFSQKLNKLLNTNTVRRKFSINAREIVNTRIEEDPLLYHMAIRDSIETVFFTEEEILQKKEQAKAEEDAKKTVLQHIIKEKKSRKLKKKISKDGVPMHLPRQ